MSATITIAAIQPELRLGEVEANLVRIEGLVRDAVRTHNPAIVTLPEAATSPNVYSPKMDSVARPIDGAPMVLFRRLARELDVVIGGGFLARRGKNTFGTYVLTEPDGSVHLHDKDIPTMWENNYYTRGRDNGLTELGSVLPGDARLPVGVACGWEWARMRTARRLRGHAQLVLGGMCWPSYPIDWPGLAGKWGRAEHAMQMQHARELPRQMALLTGAPVAMPSHVGPITFQTPMASAIDWPTIMVGETQIVERDGTVLARLSASEGEGHIAAPVVIAAPTPVDPLARRYCIPPLSISTRAAWIALNTHGTITYHARKAIRHHPWQQWPGGDMHNEIGAQPPAEQQMATTD